MTSYPVTEKEILDIFNSAGADFSLFRAPRPGEGPCWVETKSLDRMIDSSQMISDSVKRFLFPNSEETFRYTRPNVHEVEIATPEAIQPVIVLGVSACDLAGIQAIETLFADSCDDELYRTRRNNTILVGQSCQRADWACFCTEMDVNPDFSELGDLFISILDNNSYAISATSALGEQFLDKYWPNKTKAMEIEKTGPDNNKKELDLKLVKEVLDKNFESPVWQDFARKCIGCGACTYLCPTCHCFDLFAEERRGEGAHYRCYDSCMFSRFTVMAGGYNPRATQPPRLRQRYMHKYKYFVDNFNQVACCGCGRCIRSCPVNIDVRKNLKALQALATEDHDE